ncbi:type II secretion system secretin GspD [Congregibacter litoralis]|uniref:General secretion pathway protein D n=1 Tax=Congregibacter litoralis KT71 TaxID=314285 RepID=A4A5L7_9GAMM|nr:type II secretion system secretin GspD [Congregibacter litoralis]EAQ98315.2 general secretion pathway protein D [Congregibacter litoralis KT71]
MTDSMKSSPPFARTRRAFLAALCVVLASCASQDMKQMARSETVLLGEPGKVEGRPEPVSAPKAAQGSSLSVSAQELADKQADERAKPVTYRGTDRQVRLPEPQDTIRFIGDDVSLNFEQAPLDEVVHAIVGDILQLDYIVDRPIQGKVTLRTRTPIPRNELLVVLESLLKAHDALMIRGDDGRYLITGSQQAMNLRPDVTSADDIAAGFSTMVIPLQYISAKAMASILEPLAEKDAFVRVDDTRALLMMAGTREQLSGWLEIVSTFDVDMLAGMSVGMFPLENSSVNETMEAIETLMDATGGEEGGISGIVRVLPMERLNSILVVTPRAHYLDRVGDWIQRFDVDPDARFEKRLYVYPVQNTTATRLAQLLNSIYAGGNAGAAGTRQSSGAIGDQAAVAPGLSPESISGGGSSVFGGASGDAGDGSTMGGSNSASNTGSFGSGGTGSGQGARAAATAMTSVNMGTTGAGQISPLADVRVVADEENNALMIYADGKQYGIVKDALKQLDVVATQVIIEASIMEVQLIDELRYGLEWTFKNGLGNNYDGLGTLAAGAAGPAAAAGFSYTVTNSLGDISAVLNALSEESLINVISSPSVMVLDNHTAFISVGDQVPVLQGQTITNGGNSVQNITYRDTGVQLSVRPSVNAGGLVTMDIEQSVIDVGSIDSATGQRAFLDRTINSRVAVRSSESVVLGGLIRENSSLGDSGVPILREIPLFGSLFGTTTTDSRRTELLVIITPRALYNEEELRAVSDEMREQVRFMKLVRDPPRSGEKTYEK